MNCWEFKKCGREKGGSNARRKGVCPAYPNYGRQCARVTGTLCDEQVQGTFALKLGNCRKCDFYKSEHYDATYSLGKKDPLQVFPIIKNEGSIRKLLIVDDDVMIRELIEITIMTSYYQIFHAGNGQEAVEIARREKPDVIIMDIMMPIMDGIEATRIIKIGTETKNCHVIMLTAKGLKKEREKGLEAGALYCFDKPFKPLELLDKVDKLFKV